MVQQLDGQSQIQAGEWTAVIAGATVIVKMMLHLPLDFAHAVLDFGLQATDRTLVVPKVDYCIAIFLGSGAAYREQARSVPGTCYLTKGWIEAGDTPFHEYDSLVEQYARKKARWLMARILKNYTRLALIKTCQYQLECYRDYSRRTAAHCRPDRAWV